jgi:hypothetical protein
LYLVVHPLPATRPGYNGKETPVGTEMEYVLKREMFWKRLT